MKYKLLLFLLILIIPLEANALETINTECKKNNDEYECQIKGNFDYYVSALDFHLSLPSNSSISKYEIADIWQGEIDTTDNTWITLYSDEDLKDEFEIATVYIKSDKKVTGKDIKIIDLLVYDDDFLEHKVEINNEKHEKNNTKILLISIICGIIILCMIAIVLKVKKGDSK